MACYGYDIHTRYHCLFEGDSADDMAVRSNYRQLIGELFSENYVGNLAGWCEKTGRCFPAISTWRRISTATLPTTAI